MNYRNIAISELAENAEAFPENTIGQVILSVLNKKEDDTKSVKQWLFEVSDEDLFTAIEKSRQAEQPEVSFFQEEG